MASCGRDRVHTCLRDCLLRHGTTRRVGPAGIVRWAGLFTDCSCTHRFGLLSPVRIGAASNPTHPAALTRFYEYVVDCACVLVRAAKR